MEDSSGCQMISPSPSGDTPCTTLHSTKVLDPSRSLSQVLNLMDRMMENPFAALSRGMGGGSRRGFDVREDKDALYLRVDMPGLGKEDVKVFVEQNTLIIKGGGGDKNSGYDDSDRESGRRYSSRIDLPSELYKWMKSRQR
ncbi:small heat shock protein, chloroplastic-like protein isoform X1 [Cinnamomum micranthum f. kanehirae]|uniref:Small heat shock protein, chloroplastic-like protein isoform X1 n=1 Tax=Cinnamomum micranthum f. kanehirae TaxID=337451 RepID=A0A443NLC7_9MAGN|nr:small heat shock protein, chloroplastic-like protein isoform X1 [Cinnamomum micranthum f. kanehirae]